MNELGEIRPSQLIFTFGVGALLDLPNLSVLLMGLDDWDTRFGKEIMEERLLAALQHRLGRQLTQLYLPPVELDELSKDPATPAIGVPVVPFPRWMRCPFCDTLATVDSGVFKLVQDRWRPDRTRYVHEGCSRANGPQALSVRFLLACRDGHLTDFPWVSFVHQGNAPCKPARLSLREFGATGDASDIIVKCLECNQERRMADAFGEGEREGEGEGRREPFTCPGHHPHLRTVAPNGCDERARAILLGASNSWFPVTLSALSLPKATDRLGRLIEDHWAELGSVESLNELKFLKKRVKSTPALIPLFSELSEEDIWKRVEQERLGAQTAGAGGQPDLKGPEWSILSAADPQSEGKDFKLRRVAPPGGFESLFEDTVLVERVREVRALMGFNRIESNGDFTEATVLRDGRMSPLSRSAPTWVPVYEVRGEGIFVRLREESVQAWEAQPAVKSLEQDFVASHRAWRRLRRLEPEADGFPGIRFVLIHALAHALMRQIVLDCGYTAASIRERLYCLRPDEDGGPMAGILIYTAASDSEGTLGGLVELGAPLSLGRHLQQALESLRVCASDPLCAEHRPAIDGRVIHGATCHACLFVPETSCERGNRYLDRAVLIPTFASSDVAFFGKTISPDNQILAVEAAT